MNIEEIEEQIKFARKYDSKYGITNDDADFLLSTIKSQREALDKAHVLLDKYESLIDVDVVAERDKYREFLLNFRKLTPYGMYHEMIDEVLAQSALKEE